MEKGGHNIENAIVEKRYYESLKNLKEVISKFDKIQLYDNSDKYIEFFSFEDNKILFKTKDITWAKEAIKIIENKIKNIEKELKENPWNKKIEKDKSRGFGRD